MLGKKLLKLLIPLNAGQRTLFLKWMDSPVHNTDAGLTSLAHYYLHLAPAAAPEKTPGNKLYSALRKIPAEAVKAAQIWEVLYPEKPLKEGVLRVKIRQLTQQVEDFLTWREMGKDSHLKRRLFLQARVDDIPYEEYERESLRQLEKLPGEEEGSVETYYRRMQLQSDLIGHPQFDHYRADGRYLWAVNESLDAFFLLFKYRLGSEIKSREQIRGEQYEVRFQADLREEQATGWLRDNKSARLYGQLLKLQDSPDETASLAELKINFLNDHTSLPKRDLENIYFSTLNHLSRAINRGGSKYYPVILEWYQLGLDSGILLKNGKISGITFSNIALLGFRARRFDWTYTFLNDFAEALEVKKRDDILVSCRATGAFYAANYLKAIEILEGHRFSPAYRLRNRLTVIRSYYELLLQEEDVYELLERAMGRFDAFLSRNQTFSEAVKAPFRAHLRLLRKIVNSKLQRGLRSACSPALLREVESAGAVVSKEWLLEKAVE